MNDERRGAVYYEQHQKFRRIWLCVLLVFLSVATILVFGWGIYQQIARGKPWGNRPMPDSALIAVAVLAIALTVGLLLLFALTRLTVRIDAMGLHIHFFPLMRRDIPLEEIKRWTAITYRPIRDYGGWGLRYSFSKGWACNVSGNQGGLLELVDRKTSACREMHSRHVRPLRSGAGGSPLRRNRTWFSNHKCAFSSVSSRHSSRAAVAIAGSPAQ